jgi:hypothetical protein
MKRAVALALLLAAGGAAAQMECRTDPRDPDLAFALGATGQAIEFRGRNPARRLVGRCALTLDCTLREPPVALDYFIVPRDAGDAPAVWDIRRVRATFAGGGTQDCRVTASSEPRPPLPEPPPFVPRQRRH